MVFHYQLPVMALQLVIAHARLLPQNVVSVTLRWSRVARLDVAELGVSDAKSLGNLSKKLQFVWMEHPVGLGDVEQAFQHVLEQLAVALEHGGELVGKGLVPSDILFGQIKDAGDVRHL